MLSKVSAGILFISLLLLFGFSSQSMTSTHSGSYSTNLLQGTDHEFIMSFTWQVYILGEQAEYDWCFVLSSPIFSLRLLLLNELKSLKNRLERKNLLNTSTTCDKFAFQLKGLQEICSICRKDITTKSQAISCPGCGTFFHLTHFAEWIRTNGHCPMCLQDILMTVSLNMRGFP